MPEPIGARAVEVDSHGAGCGQDADVLEHVVHLRGGLGDPVEATPLAAEELEPVQDAVVITASLAWRQRPACQCRSSPRTPRRRQRHPWIFTTLT